MTRDQAKGVQIFQLANKPAALGDTQLPSVGAVTTVSPRDQALDIINNPAKRLHAAYHKVDAAASATVDRCWGRRSEGVLTVTPK